MSALEGADRLPQSGDHITDALEACNRLETLERMVGDEVPISPTVVGIATARAQVAAQLATAEAIREQSEHLAHINVALGMVDDRLGHIAQNVSGLAR